MLINSVFTLREYASTHIMARCAPELHKETLMFVSDAVDLFGLTAMQPLALPPLRLNAA